MSNNYKTINFKSKLIKTTGNIPDDAIYGKVISIQSNKVVVETLDNKIYTCTLQGTIISNNSKYANIAAAGDNVWFVQKENSNPAIIKIDNRNNFFSRKDPGNRNKEQILAANIDNVLIFTAALRPALNLKFIDRFIIAATLGGVKPILCINKIDLCNKDDKEYLDNVVNIYKNNGIDVFTLSALNKIGFEPILEKIKGTESVVTGPSGAGKSTFLNTILGQEVQTVSDISLRTNKGTHTTSFSRRYRLENYTNYSSFLSDDYAKKENKTALIDTPGIREFGLWNITKDELYLFFPDFIKYINNCKFDTCTHTHEPGCAVKEAVEKGELFYERYESYYNLMMYEL
ncbi:MAG: ribosome small subunit-dependent GTPase A [Bacteroidetes bacterium]|nr:ribosome small subunit-dependent GTPase A [Bacteroidota bacterium]